MDKKTFHSRLFKRKIQPDNPDYWIILYAEVQHRLKQIEDLNCLCHFCRDERNSLQWTLKNLIKDDHIEENPKPRNFAGKGYCAKIKDEEQKQGRPY